VAILTLPHPDTLSVRAKAFVFEDAKSRALLRRIEQVAPSQATVLLFGETGTGKEIVAHHVHDLSQRRDKPFIAVNCGALTDSLVESELFGHERGAFTGATSSKAGWFEAAHGGTLFLDEIGDLSLPAQVKLLRVLQEGEVVRLGSREAVPIDVRLIAATNVPVEFAVAAGRFRADLYYRLNVASLTLPPLRERRDDILPLAEHFLALYAKRLGIEHVSVGDDAARDLLRHGWPGNIRELENVIHHALLVCQGGCVTADVLRLTELPQQAAAQADADGVGGSDVQLEDVLARLFEQNLPNLYQQIEERVMKAAHQYCERNQLQTARLLGISRNVVRARLIQCGEISSASSRPPPNAAGLQSELEAVTGCDS
jgi:sigma-54-specific transcriptional regulator